VLLLVPTFSHAAWKVKTLSKGGASNSIAVDSSGNPHISYLDDSNPSDYVLRHAFFNGKSWQSEVVDSGNVGWDNSIAVDSLGHIHVSYFKADKGGGLRYAYFDGTTWGITSVDATGGYSTSIAVDNNNLPRISYVDSSTSLKYAQFDGTDWKVETIPRASAFRIGGTSLAIGPLGDANIGFTDVSNFTTIRWATNLSGSWVIGQVGYGYQPSLALDSEGKPHIVFNSGTSNGIFYSSYDGVQWVTQNLTDLAASALGIEGIGEFPAIALDSQDRPHVTYALYVRVGGSSVEPLIYARFNGVGWEFEVVDYKNSAYQNFIALDPWDLPHVSYRQNNGKLKYANTGIKPPQIATKSLKEGKSGKKYRAMLKAKDGKKPYQWEVTNANLPPDLELDPTGVISGIPVEAGEFVFEVKVSDGLGLSRTATFTLIVQ